MKKQYQKLQLSQTHYLGVCFCVVFLFFCLGGSKSSQIPTEDDAKARERAALMRSAYAEASFMQQTYVQLVAPDVQYQLQQLAEEIAVATGADMAFRVHIINYPYLGTMSMASGDIFIPTGYLNMVENRDEIAFGLAREIAIQHGQLPLRDIEEQYREARRAQMTSTVFGVVVTSATHAVFDYYVTSEIHEAIARNLDSPASEIAIAMQQIETARSLYSMVDSSMRWISPGWIPDMATEASLKMLTHMIEKANEEANATRRDRKNKLGLAYLKMAGYDVTSGQNVIDKLEEWWQQYESKE